MSNLNKVMLIGRLGKDPDMQHFDSGSIKAAFPLATTDYSTRDGERIEQTDWHNVVVWGRSAEFAEKYLRKGNLVFLEGKIKTRSWDDQNGNKRYITEIIAFTVKSLGGRSENSGDGSYVKTNTAQSQVKDSGDVAPVSADTPNESKGGDFEDDLPF